MTPDDTNGGLHREIDDLKARLEHAEETLRALRSGEVDPLVVPGTRGGQAFSLRGADRVYRALLEHMSDGAAIVSLDGAVLCSSRRLAALLRTPLDTPVGPSLLDLVAAADRPVLQALIGQAAGHESQGEITLHAADGTAVPVLLSFGSIAAEQARLLCVSVTDLTGRKRVEDERQQLVSLVENSSDFIGVATLDEQVTFVNAAGCRLVGIDDPAEVASMTIWDFAQPSVRESLREMILSLIKVSGTWTGVTQFRHFKTGAVIPVEVSTFVVRHTPTGQPLCLGAVARDITERDRAEAAILRERDFSRMIVESMPGIVYLFDDTGTCRRWNRNLEIVSGYSAGEIAGMSADDFCEPESRLRVRERMRRVFEDGKADVEAPLLTRSGRRIPYFFVGHRTVLDGRPFLVGMGFDVSEHAQSHEALLAEHALLARRVEEQTADLTEANAALASAARHKDDFLASMSHELRTPLNAVLGMSEALQEQVYGPLNDQQLTSLKTIEESGRHLLSLINDILDLSKIDAGRLFLDIAPVGVESVTQASLRFIKQSADLKRLTVSSSVDRRVGAIAADERRLKQILGNLLSNAVKFTRDGRAIGVEVRGDAEGRMVHFTVWDEGVGIAPEDLPRLFQTFVQLDSGLSREHDGTGLGLVLVRRMAELQGGSVGVESTLGQGSRFRVSLPWEGPAEAVDPADPEQVRPVLVVAPGRDAIERTGRSQSS